MNPTSTSPGQPVAASPRPSTGVPSGTGTPADPQKLAAMIRENRAALDRGWAELNRLNQQLAALDRIQASPKPGQANTSPAAAEALKNAA
jgi:hypothetical protein